ncbi:MAG: hypothetical protein ABIO70_12345 [Pseudomonadota bacterium]
MLKTIVVEVDLPREPAPRARPGPPPVGSCRLPSRGKHAAGIGTQEGGEIETSVEGIGTRVAADPWVARREALRGHVAKARAFARVVRRGRQGNVAEVAAETGLSAVRVRQLLFLLNLAPEILADVEDPAGTGPVPSETDLRKLAGVRPLHSQIRAYEGMTGRRIRA